MLTKAQPRLLPETSRLRRWARAGVLVVVWWSAQRPVAFQGRLRNRRWGCCWAGGPGVKPCLRSQCRVLFTHPGDDALPNGLDVTFEVTELRRLTGSYNTMVGNNEGSMVRGPPSSRGVRPLVNVPVLNPGSFPHP